MAHDAIKFSESTISLFPWHRQMTQYTFEAQTSIACFPVYNQVNQPSLGAKIMYVAYLHI